MKIVVPVARGRLCSHFGHCERFEVFEVDTASGTVVGVSSFEAPPHEPGLLPTLLAEKGVNVVIAGGMGSRAQELLRQKGIEARTGVSPEQGVPEELVRSYLSGSLISGVNVCEH